jgi:spore coat polysaccharide biosynthesis protein SpsF (cytidylyltransferase family)
MGSTRLPGKALLRLEGEPLLLRLCKHVALSRVPDTLAVATSDQPRDRAIVAACESWGIPVFCGPEYDLTARLLGAAREYRLDAVVRVTGDNPLTDPDGIDALIRAFRKHDVDMVHNVHHLGYPYGTGAELMKVAVLEWCDRTLSGTHEREYVFHYVRRSAERFSCIKLNAPPELHRPGLFLTVDYSEDVWLARRIYQHFGGRNDMRLREIVQFLDANPEIGRVNSHLHEALAN